METVQAGIRNALLTAGKPYLQRGTNSPYNGDTQTQYFADASRAFARKNLRWSSNMVLAQVQVRCLMHSQVLWHRQRLQS